jgi:hypothetical protein
MKKNAVTPSQIIEKMIDLHLQQDEIEQQMKVLKPAFHEACHQLSNDQIDTDRASIHFRITPGKWDYPIDIINQDRHLRLLKKHFRDTHEPISGREEYWLIKLVRK